MSVLPTPDDARKRNQPPALAQTPLHVPPPELTSTELHRIDEVRGRLDRSRGQRNAGIATAVIGALSLLPRSLSLRAPIDLALGASHLTFTVRQAVAAVVILAGTGLGVAGMLLEHREITASEVDSVARRAVHSTWSDDDAYGARSDLGRAGRLWDAVMLTSSTAEWGWVAPATIVCAFLAVAFASVW